MVAMESVFEFLRALLIWKESTIWQSIFAERLLTGCYEKASEGLFRPNLPHAVAGFVPIDRTDLLFVAFPSGLVSSSAAWEKARLKLLKMKTRGDETVPGPEKGLFLEDPAEIATFQESLKRWFVSCGRDYPWRRTRDPYAILVSEAMLQQTRIATVLGRGYYTRWLAAFPGWAELARASEQEVLKQWEGLGYYNRARNLHKAAVIVTRDHCCDLPEDLDALLALPGVGRYTAGAVMSFAFNKKAPIVDGNVSRVLSRVFACPIPIDSPEGLRLAWERAVALTPDLEPRVYNSAVMELGQRICTRATPECPACPVASQCRGRREGRETDFPVKKGSETLTRQEERVILAIREGEVLLAPESGSRRKGLWRLPEISEETSADLEEVLRFAYAITRYHVSMRVFLPVPRTIEAVVADAGGEEGGEARWFALSPESEMPPLGSPYRKALQLFSEIREDLIVNG
jgi:A/G-specific adenine glycosylase